MSQILEMLLEIPNISLTNSQAEQLVEWLLVSIKGSNDVILSDILNCLAAAVQLREVKMTKVTITNLCFAQFTH